MSSLDLDLDSHMNHLETEWRQANESGNVARRDHRLLAADPKANVILLWAAQARIERAEARKAQIMAKIEHLENSMSGAE